MSGDRILFASCNSQHREQVLWPSIVSRNATAFVWAGDAIYADDFWPRERFFHVSQHRDATPQTIKDLYQELLDHPGYKALLDKNLTILGTVDDHDYGANNGDRNYQYKRESGMAYLDFLQHQSNTNLTRMTQRAAAGKGVYGVKVFDFSKEQPLLSDDEAGVESGLGANANKKPLSDKSVAIFLLDIRTNKTPWKKGLQKCFVDYEADFLGEEQWKWFEEAIGRSTAAVNIFVSGLQFHPDRFFDGNKVEDWSRFPMSQHRLYQTVLKSNVTAPILVSGDVHMAELLRKDCKRSGDDKARMLLEVTTSGMTHSWGTGVCARPHSFLPCRMPYVDWSISVGMHIAHLNHAWRDLVDIGKSQHEGAKRRFQYYLGLNFGEFEFDWERRQVIIRILGGEVNGKPYLSTRWDFDTLSGRTPANETGFVQPAHYEDQYRWLSPYGAKSDDFFCIAYRGPQTTMLKVFGFISSTSTAAFLLMLPFLMPAVLTIILWRRKVPKQ